MKEEQQFIIRFARKYEIERINRVLQMLDEGTFSSLSAFADVEHFLRFAKDEIDRLTSELAEKDATIKELVKRASHYAAVRDNAVDHGYKQAKEIGILRKELEWYAEEEQYKVRVWGLNPNDYYPAEIDNDRGQRAREALKLTQVTQV